MNLIPKNKKPYFIHAPSWTYKSSGVKVLHLLCHALNEIGETAFLIPISQIAGAYRHPELNVRDVSDIGLDINGWENFKKEFDPIIVYPDIIKGNPLEVKNVVRYLLAPVGKHGGDVIFPQTDMVYYYSTMLGDNVLFIPTFNEDIFYKPIEGTPRSGAVYYAHKYHNIFGNPLSTMTYDATQITGTPQEIAGMLRKAEVCYVYECTEVAIQALMCGCKVIPIVTGFWDGMMPEECVDKDWGLVPMNTMMKTFDEQLRNFVNFTQAMS